MSTTRMRAAIVVVMAAAMALAGCSSGDSDDGGGGGKGGDSDTPGVEGTTIKYGLLQPLSGPVGPSGQSLVNGSKAYWGRANAENKVDGKYTVELVIADTEYDPNVATQAFNQQKDDVAMFGIFGQSIVNAILPALQRENMIARPAGADSTWVHNPNLMPFGSTYQTQIVNGLDWYFENEGQEGDSVCAAITQDAVGETLKKGGDYWAEASGTPIDVYAEYTSADTEFTVPALKLKDCDVIFAATAPVTMIGLIGQVAANGTDATWIIPSAPYNATVFQGAEFQDYLQSNVIVVGDAVAWGDESIPAMVQMLADLDEFTPDQQPDQWFATGYLEAMAVHQLLNAAADNDDFSRQGIIDAMNGLDELDFQGLMTNYKYGPPEDRDPPREDSILRYVGSAPTGLEFVEKFQSPHSADAPLE